MSALTSLTGNSLNFTGLATGIDTNKIVDGLTSINSNRIAKFLDQKKDIADQQTIFASVQVKLLDLQGQVGRLSRSIAGAFDKRTATSSDESIVTATASSSAQAGTFNIRVQQLAQAQQLASGTVSDINTTIKTGSVQFKVGNGTTTTVNIDSTNNTLRGLADAINNATGDVRASIIKNGDYRLLLTSTKTGEANTIQITNNLTGGSGTDVNLSASTVQAAKDAEVFLGEGAGAISTKSATNKLDGLITGVTLNLTKADTGKTVTLAIDNDIESAKTSINDFVTSFNGVVDYIDDRDDYDSATQTAGALLGNKDIIDLQNDLVNVISSTIAGGSNANRLSAIGVTFSSTGRLQVDSDKLDKALNGQLTGVSMNDIKTLFALTGTSDNSGVNFLLGSDKTKPSGPNPYQVNISRAASRASISGVNVLAGSIDITALNNTFSVKVNNITSTLLTINAGTYTASGLAAEIQSLINANSALAGNQVNVDLDAGRLRLGSQIFGSISQVSFTGGTALGELGPLGITTAQVGVGVDVAGKFVIDGKDELASGIGQVLNGSIGNANTEGLQVRVSADSQQVGSGLTANLTVTQGVASKLNQVLNKYLDPIDGRFKTIDKKMQDNIKSIDESIEKQNTSLTEQKDALVLQFAAMETSVARLKGLGEQLSAQFRVLNY
jgi:flagellar hook-associated protein 2